MQLYVYVRRAGSTCKISSDEGELTIELDRAGKKEINIYKPNKYQWDRFWHSLDLCKYWKNNYGEGDSESYWEIDMAWRGIKIKASGGEAYPAPFHAFLDELIMLINYCPALKEVVKG